MQPAPCPSFCPLPRTAGQRATEWSAYSRCDETPRSAVACQLTPRDRLQMRLVLCLPYTPTRGHPIATSTSRAPASVYCRHFDDEWQCQLLKVNCQSNCLYAVFWPTISVWRVWRVMQIVRVIRQLHAECIAADVALQGWVITRSWLFSRSSTECDYNTGITCTVECWIGSLSCITFQSIFWQIIRLSDH